MKCFCPPLSGGCNLHVHQVDSQPNTSVHTPLSSGHTFSQQGLHIPPSLLPSSLPPSLPPSLLPPSLLPSSSLPPPFHCHLICVVEVTSCQSLTPICFTSSLLSPPSSSSPLLLPPSSSLLQSSVAIGPLVIYISGFLTTLLLRLLNKVIGRYVSFYPLTPLTSSLV